MFEIHFENEATAQVEAAGETLLAISLRNNIQHVHACGGNARCSTCRVAVLGPAAGVPARNEAEGLLAQRKGLPEHIRLACQLRPTGSMRVRRLVFDEEDLKEASQGTSSGREENIAVLFSDVRSFTRFSELNLPYDVVHVLNRYFHRMGDAVLRHGGRIDKYMGDGLMALFGVGQPDERLACTDALRAAFDMLFALEDVNRYLRATLDTEFRIGIGIHFGEAVLGEIGHPSHRQFTALGDTVNLASRVESATKRAGARLLVTESVFERARDSLVIGRRFSARMKGKAEAHSLYEPTALCDYEPGVTSVVARPESSPSFLCRVVSVLRPAEGTLAIGLDSESGSFRFHPGQCADLTLDPGSAQAQSHTFSFASAPDERILFVTRQRSSPFKQRLGGLSAGDRVRLSLPMGTFVLPDRMPESLVMIAGGIGITPFRSMLRDAMRRAHAGDPLPIIGRDLPVHLFYSCRRKEQAVFLGEFLEMSDQLSLFTITPVLTEFSLPDWRHERGRVSREMLRRHLPDHLAHEFLVAGPPAMVQAMHSMLRLAGIHEERIRAEEFEGY